MEDVQPKVDFYLSSLEEEVRSELQDNEVRLTQSKTEGVVLLQMQEDSLTKLLEILQDKKDGDINNTWSQEKKQMESEICRLKALLDEAQAKAVPSPEAQTEALQANLKKTKKILKRFKMDLEHQTSENRDLQLKLETVQKEEEALQQEVEAKKLEVQIVKQLRNMADKELEKTTCYLEDQLLDQYSKTKALDKDLKFEVRKTDDLRATLRKEKEEAKTALEKFQVSQKVQLAEATAETGRVRAALKKAEDQLEMERLHFLQKKTSLKEENNLLKETLRKKEEEVQSHGLQFHQEKTSLEKENNLLKTTLSKKEEEVQSHRLQWQQEKTSLLEEMDVSKAFYSAQLQQNNEHVAASLKELNLQLERAHLAWEEEKSSLVQAKDDLMKSLQEKEQESCMKTRLEELERKLTKKKRRKWYRKLF